jgi:hypothetical protein
MNARHVAALALIGSMGRIDSSLDLEDGARLTASVTKDRRKLLISRSFKLTPSPPKPFGFPARTLAT